MITETKCSDHPDAPHGFDRNGSHAAGHYVCECSGWTPPNSQSLQARLRDGADICHARNIQLDYAKVAEEAADRIDALEAEIQILTAEREVYAATADRAMAEVESLQLRNQELAANSAAAERERVLDLLRELDYSPNCHLAIRIREGEIV